MLKKSLLAMSVLATLFTNTIQAQPISSIGELSNDAIRILSSFQNDGNISYVNVRNLIENNERLSQKLINYQVINNYITYVFDFSEVSSDNLDKAKKKVNSLLGVSFDSQYLAISSYKGALLYSPFNSIEDKNFENIQNRIIAQSEPILESSEDNKGEGQATLPQVGFYISIGRSITPDDCTFNKSLLHMSGETGWPSTKRSFCDNTANIALIYKVTLARSLAHGTIGNGTPDNKIVRISIDDSSSGAGIHLNDKLDYVMNRATWTVYDGWVTDFATDAWAQDYKFDISASNSKAEILQKYPANLNTNYQNTEIQSFTYGVSGGGELEKDGPKAQINASGEYSQTTKLTYDTADYKVKALNKSARDISFIWEREAFATAESIKNKETAAIGKKELYPVNISRVNPIGYANFTPKLDVIYKANNNQIGTTQFTISSSVNIRPIYHATYQHAAIWLAFHGYENTPRNRVTEDVRFDVDWEHPVFTGGRPVNLQLGSFNSKCVDIDNANHIQYETCDKNSASQSFIYGDSGQYISAKDTTFCLDGEDLTTLQRCSENLSQKWEWVEGSDLLMNTYTGQVLSHDIETGKLTLNSISVENTSDRTLTSFTDLFNVSDLVSSLSITPNDLDNGQIPSNIFTIDFRTYNSNWNRDIYMPEFPVEGMRVNIKSNATYSFYLHGDLLGKLDGRRVNRYDSIGFIFTNGHWKVNGDLDNHIAVTPNDLTQGFLPSNYSTVDFSSYDGNWIQDITMPSYPQDGMIVNIRSNSTYAFYLHGEELGDLDNMKVSYKESHSFKYSSTDNKYVRL